MNICLLSNKYPPDPGGVAISVQRLARGLAAGGQTVHVCTPGQNVVPGQVVQTREDGLILHRLGVHRRVDDTRTAWFELVTRLHHQIGFDILHGYYLVGAGFVAVYAGRYLGVPVVVSVRGNDLDRTVFNPREAGSILWALANASAVTAVSHDLARKARALKPGCQAHVIPNGVDASRFVPAPPDPALRASLSRAKITSGGGSHTRESAAWEPPPLQNSDSLNLVSDDPAPLVGSTRICGVSSKRTTVRAL